MTAANIHVGYVITRNGTVLVQTPSDNQWGFVLESDDQTWPGGVGVGVYEALADNDVRINDEDRQRLGWILDEARA